MGCERLESLQNITSSAAYSTSTHKARVEQYFVHVGIRQNSTSSVDGTLSMKHKLSEAAEIAYVDNQRS
jgi:hypothetical protein